MESVAPWAEPVLMTADELLRLPEDEWRYELVEGRLVRVSPTGSEHGLTVMALLLAVGNFAKDQSLGDVFPAETGFLISLEGTPDTVLAPDLAYVSRGRGSETRTKGYARVAPDLVAEVASPSQGRAEMSAKARRWLTGGVRLVWVIFPESRTVEVWRPGEPARTLGCDDELSGEDVLLGFAYPIKNLFS
jgi:Uma2 family endonuclease